MSSDLTDGILFCFVHSVKLGAKIGSTPFDWNDERQEVVLRPGWKRTFAHWKCLGALSFVYTVYVISTLFYWYGTLSDWWQFIDGGTTLTLHLVLPIMQIQVFMKPEKIAQLLNLVRGIVKTHGPNLDPFHRSRGEGRGLKSQFGGWVLLGFAMCLPLLTFGFRLKAINSNSRMDTIRPVIGYLLQNAFGGDSQVVGSAQVVLAIMFDVWFTVYYLSFAMLVLIPLSVLGILGIAAVCKFCSIKIPIADCFEPCFKS